MIKLMITTIIMHTYSVKQLISEKLKLKLPKMNIDNKLNFSQELYKY